LLHDQVSLEIQYDQLLTKFAFDDNLRLYNKVLQPLVERVEQNRGTSADFGLLPIMAGHSKGQIGALLAESFSERIVSACNLVLTDGNTLLGSEELEMLVAGAYTRPLLSST